VNLALIVLCLMVSWPVSANAQAGSDALREPVSDASVDDFVRALKPEVRTRSMGRNLKVEPSRIDVTVNFDFDSARLRPESTPQLERLATAMRTDALMTLRFRIEGHTDAKGGARYNEVLSAKRAQAVVDFLVGQGVGAQRLSPVGMGFSELLDPGDPIAARNRRVRVQTLD
jgi:outer membrane protein OmpA-like peptidoglycan-associated protein